MRHLNIARPLLMTITLAALLGPAFAPGVTAEGWDCSIPLEIKVQSDDRYKECLEQLQEEPREAFDALDSILHWENCEGAPTTLPNNWGSIDPKCAIDLILDNLDDIPDVWNATNPVWDILDDLLGIVGPDAFELTNELVGRITEKASDVDEIVRRCRNTHGANEIFLVKDSVKGQYFSITILYGLSTKEVRVSYNAQIPRAHDGVTLYMTDNLGQRSYPLEAGINNAYCGDPVGHVVGDDWKVRAEFAGVDLSFSQTKEETFSYTVTVSTASTFKISLTDLGKERTFGFGVAGTWTVTESLTITVTPFLKVFEGSYYADTEPELHPLYMD